jgi:hypothetical protein
LLLQAFMGRRIRRQWTMAKDTSDSTTCQVLPFLLDISLALYDTLDLVKSSVDSEVVFQATLQVRQRTCKIVMQHVLQVVLLPSTAAATAV